MQPRVRQAGSMQPPTAGAGSGEPARDRWGSRYQFLLASIAGAGVGGGQGGGCLACTSARGGPPHESPAPLSSHHGCT